MRDIQCDRPSAYCESCQGEIWKEEPVFRWRGRWICLDCFKSAVDALLEDDPRQVALEMGVEVESYV